MRYWFCITKPENWEKVKEHKTWGVEDRYKTTMKRLTLDEILVFYVTSPGKAIEGIYKVASEWYYNETSLGWDKLCPYRIKINPLVMLSTPIPLDEKLIEELLFITDKRLENRGRIVWRKPEGYIRLSP